MSTIRQIIHEAAGKCPVLGVDIKAAVDVYPALVSVGAIDDGDLAIVVDGTQQRLRVLKGPDSILKEIVCSTAADGFGNTTAVKAHGTTSTGLLKIGQLVGKGQPVGMEFKKLAPTGDIHKPAESGNHAAMTTRILTLKGLQTENESASYRGIYIHGTNREQQLGRRASGGCVRVSNADVMWLAENIPPSTPVYILGDPITTNPAFPSSDDCKPERAERQMSKERPKGDVSKKVPNKMKETAQPKISISEIRKMIRTELIREMQEEPVDLAYFGDVNDLPADMVDEVAPDDLEVLTALQEMKIRQRVLTKEVVKLSTQPSKKNGENLAPKGNVQSVIAVDKWLAVPDNLFQAIMSTYLKRSYFTSELGIDLARLEKMLAVALAVSGRESSFGQGTYYSLGSDTLDSAYEELRDLWTAVSNGDKYSGASLGPTQIKYRLHYGPGTDLNALGKKLGIKDRTDLSDYSKGVMAAIPILNKLYDKALSVGYDSQAPSFNESHKFKSTGDAALDLALVGYNMGDQKITKYCGKGPIKIACTTENQDDYVQNYMPYLESSAHGRKMPWRPSAGILTSTGYVNEVAEYLETQKLQQMINSVFK